ncbi:MAG: PQQ-binding-like beta-propeller repeat protein [Chloroflexi bacterium]|nr:PQQ-binding-like beta-propeller repeat protein [Chloroflexota bacterium]
MRKLRIRPGKKSLLALVILVVGIFVFACAPGGTPAKGWSGAVVVDNNLYIGSMAGKLVGLNLADRTRLWNDLTLEAPRASTFGCAGPAQTVAIYGTPAVSGELIYMAGYNGKVYAVTAARGIIRWVYPREGTLGSPVVGGILVAGNNIYFGAANGKVYALDAATGDPAWPAPFATGQKIWSTPVSEGGTLFIGSFDKKLYAIDAATGKEKWAFETEGAIATTPVVYKNTVYFGSFDRSFYAVDTAAGKLAWRYPAEGEANVPGSWFWARPVVLNNTIYAGNLDGKVYVLDTATGKPVVAPLDLGNGISSNPVLVDSKLIIATGNGEIWAIDNNVKNRIQDLKDKVYAPLSASGEIIYVHSQNRTLSAVNTRTGVVLWNMTLNGK